MSMYIVQTIAKVMVSIDMVNICRIRFMEVRYSIDI